MSSPAGPTDVLGLVLAAGAGRRMGGPKALLRAMPGGPTFVEEAIRRLREAGCARIVVVIGASSEAVAAMLPRDVQVAECAQWAQGMGASLRTGLALAASLDPVPDAALVTLVDLPDVPTAAYARVLAACAGGGSAVLGRAAYAGVPGHPVLLGREHWEAITGYAQGDRGARDYLAGRSVRLVECGDLATGKDVDHPSDLSRLDPST